MYAVALNCVRLCGSVGNRAATTGLRNLPNRLLNAKNNIYRPLILQHKRYYAIGEVIKLDGPASLPRKLEDESFRKEYMMNRPLPAGRNIWTDNPRLDVRPVDPLPYSWPNNSEELAAYDPALTPTWELSYFINAWNQDTRDTQGGDWGNTRKGVHTPPRIQVYYANIVSHYLKGEMEKATIVFNHMMTDYLVPVGEIPYGTYSTMMKVYYARENYERCLDVFQSIASYHIPTADDYALAMRAAIQFRKPRLALEIWDSLRLRDYLKPNTETWVQLLRAHAACGSFNKTLEICEYAKQVQTDSSQAVSQVKLYENALEVLAECGAVPQFMSILSTIRSNSPEELIKQALFGLIKMELHTELISFVNKLCPDIYSPPQIIYLSSVMIASCYLGKSDVVEKILITCQENEILPSIEGCLAFLENINQLDLERDTLASFASGIPEFDYFERSVRNYRRVQNALMNSSSDNLGGVMALVFAMTQNGVDLDSTSLQFILKACWKAKKADLAIAHWEGNVLAAGLVPTKGSYLYYFKTLGACSEHTHIIATFHLLEQSRLLLSYEVAAAIVSAIHPDSNYFGAISTRKEHAYWLSRSKDISILTIGEVYRLKKFVKHFEDSLDYTAHKALRDLIKYQHNIINGKTKPKGLFEPETNAYTTFTPPAPPPREKMPSFKNVMSGALREEFSLPGASSGTAGVDSYVPLPQQEREYYDKVVVKTTYRKRSPEEVQTLMQNRENQVTVEDIEELVESGEISEEDGQALLEELEEQGKLAPDELPAEVDELDQFNIETDGSRVRHRNQHSSSRELDENDEDNSNDVEDRDERLEKSRNS